MRGTRAGAMMVGIGSLMVWAFACSGPIATPAVEPDCTGFDDVIDQPPITVRVRNESAAPIYLGNQTPGCGGTIELFLSIDSEQLAFRRNNRCSDTCFELQQGESACDLGCVMPPVVYVEPGGHYDVANAWQGILSEPRAMPSGCYFAAADRAETCPQIVPAPEGEYVFTAHAWDAISDCAAPMTCMCAPNSTGACVLDGLEVRPMGTPREATSTFAFPSEGIVEIVFE